MKKQKFNLTRVTCLSLFASFLVGVIAIQVGVGTFVPSNASSAPSAVDCTTDPMNIACPGSNDASDTEMTDANDAPAAEMTDEDDPSPDEVTDANDATATELTKNAAPSAATAKTVAETEEKAETEEEPVSIFQSILSMFRASLATPAEEAATDRSVMEQGAEVQVTAEMGETMEEEGTEDAMEEGTEETMEARINAMQEESEDALNAAAPPAQAVAPEQTIEVAAFKMLGTATYSLFVEPFVTLFAMVFGW